MTVTPDHTARVGTTKSPAVRCRAIQDLRKGMNSTMVARKPQRNNMTAPTRAKSRELAVVDITAGYAFVEGITDTYEVSFRSLTCTCEAGRHGLKCSHVAAAIEERARMHGFSHIMLGRTQDHAEAFAALQRAKGRRTCVIVSAGWFIVQHGPGTPPPVRPVRSFAELQARAEELYA